MDDLVSGFASEDSAWVADSRLETDVVELDRLVSRLEAEKLRRLAEVDRRQTYPDRTFNRPDGTALPAG